MGIRFKADHLACPCCGAPITPLNRLTDGVADVAGILSGLNPQWNSREGACESCVQKVRPPSLELGLMDRLRSRLLYRETAPVRGRDTEAV